MSVQWRVRLPLWGHFQKLQQQMSLQGFIFRKSHFNWIEHLLANDGRQTVMRISFGAVDGIQVLPAVTLGCSYTSQKPVLVTTCKRKTGQWTVQTNSTLQVAFVCVLKIETHSENRGHWTVWRNAVFSLRFPWQTILWISSRDQNYNKSQHWLSISPAMSVHWWELPPITFTLTPPFIFSAQHCG